MERRLEQIAMSLNIDPKILVSVFNIGYSNGWDDCDAFHENGKVKLGPLESFEVEKHLGQKE